MVDLVNHDHVNYAWLTIGVTTMQIPNSDQVMVEITIDCAIADDLPSMGGKIDVDLPCVCVCACARACVRMQMRIHIHVCVCINNRTNR